MSRKLVILDDGHGANTAGKRTPNFSDGSHIKEWVWNNAVTLQLGEVLQSRGYDIAYTKATNRMEDDTPINDRVATANKLASTYINNYGATIEDIVFISSHYNAFNGVWDACKGGIETLYSDMGDAETKRLATLIQSSLVLKTKKIDRGIKARGNLGLLRSTTMRAVIVEYGFMDVMADALLMTDDDHIFLCACAVADAIDAYFGVSKPINKGGDTVETVSKWAEGAWVNCKDWGILDGTRPKSQVTREELACVIDRLIRLEVLPN